MRVNIYAEEMTERIEIISKEIDGQVFTGLRLYLELPTTVDGKQYQGPFMHRPGDDDSAAITFWGKRDLRGVIEIMKRKLDEHYAPGDKKRLDAALAGKDAVPLTSPSVAPADSESGSAVGSVGAAPGLPEFPTVFRTILPDAIAGQYESIVRGADYDTLRTVTLLAIKERDEAWTALRDAYYGVGSHDSAAWQKKHAATIAAARRGG